MRNEKENAFSLIVQSPILWRSPEGTLVQSSTMNIKGQSPKKTLAWEHQILNISPTNVVSIGYEKFEEVVPANLR